MVDELLADVNDVTDILGRDLTDLEANRVESVLVKASALFRRYSGQQFTLGYSTVWLTVRDGQILLPQRPVVSVGSVQTGDGSTVEFTFANPRLFVSPAWSGRQLRVTYEHGGVVPDLVRATVADVAQKVLTIPDEAASGAQQRTVTEGPFSETYTYAQWALGGQASFSPTDEKIARSYRTSMVGSIRVR